MKRMLNAAILALFCVGFGNAPAQDWVPGLRSYEDAQYYVRLLGSLNESYTVLTNQAARLNQPAPALCQDVVIISGALIEAAKQAGLDLDILKRKYSPEEFDALSRAKTTKSDQVLLNTYLTVTLSDNGNFTMRRTSDGKYLIYPSYTSAFSVNVDGHKYCNRYTSGESATILRVTQPLSVSGYTATIKYSTTENVDIVQRFILEGDACRFEVTANNRDSTSHRVQVRYLFDTQVHDNDGSPLYAEPVGTRIKETEVTPLNFSQWQAWLRPVRNPGDIYGIGSIISLPTRVVFAWWPNATRSAWDYTPNPAQLFYTEGYVTSPNSDSCVLYYMDLGVLQPGTTRTVSTSYGLGAAQGASRARLIEALTHVASALTNYQAACAAVAADAFSMTAMTARRDLNLKDIAIDIALDLLADGTMSRTAGKLFATPFSDEFTRWLVRNIADKAAKKGFSLGAKALATWMLDPLNGGIDPDWDRNDPEFSTTAAYIQAFILTTMSNDISRISQVLEQTVAQIPDPLPPGYPTEHTIAMLQKLRYDVMQLTPVKDRGKEAVVYWAIPGVLDDSTYRNYNPLLLGVSSKVAEGHKLYVRKKVLGGLNKFKVLRRVGCIAWQAGTGALKIVGHVASVKTGPLAIPIGAGIQGVFWSGVVACQNLALANTVFDVIGKNYAVFQLALDLESIQSDIEYASSTFEAVANTILAAQNLEGSLQMAVSELDADDLKVGWLDSFGSVHARLLVKNNDSRRSGYFRVFATISRMNDRTGVYDDLVSTDTFGRQLPPLSSFIEDFVYQVPVGILTADRYLVECHVITSSGYFYRPAFFRACKPLGCWLDDRIHRIDSGNLMQGQSFTGTLDTTGTSGVTELVLTYPGSDLDLHVYDAQGRHVGMNYSLGTVEIGIPGATYSGPSSRPEVIRVPQTQPQRLRYEVIAVQTAGSEGWELFAAREGGEVVQDVTSDVRTAFNSWTLDRSSGALIASITLSNSNGKSGVPLEKIFWYAITETTNVMLATVSGYTNGMAYYDVSAQIEAQLRSIGNGDLRLDPGESVTFTVPIYSRDRSIPAGHVYSIWADPPAAVVALPPRLKASRSSAGALILAWPLSQAEYVLEESDSMSQPNWRVMPASPVLQGQENTVTVPIGSGTKFYRLKQK